MGVLSSEAPHPGGVMPQRSTVSDAMTVRPRPRVAIGVVSLKAPE